MDPEAARHPPDHLLQAFSATDYHVRVAGSHHFVKPGRLHDALDASIGQRPWAIVTAFNPHACRIDDSDNRRHHRRLCRRVTELGRETHPAVNVDPSGRWPDEAALLIVDSADSEVDTLAGEFDQAAVLTGRPGRNAILRLYGDRWPQTLPEWARKAA